MKNHQYPQHVVDAVQNAILIKTNIYHGPVAQQLAEVALEALWEASRIESMHTLEVLDTYPAPTKEADPTGYTTARLALLEHRIREAIGAANE